VKLALALDLTLETIEEVTLEFHYLAAAQAGHVHMITLGPALVVMLLAFEVHQVKFVNQAITLKQGQRPVDGYTVNMRIQFVRLAQDLAGVEVLFRRLDYAEDSATLAGHPQPA